MEPFNDYKRRPLKHWIISYDSPKTRDGVAKRADTTSSWAGSSSKTPAYGSTAAASREVDLHQEKEKAMKSGNAHVETEAHVTRSRLVGI